MESVFCKIGALRGFVLAAPTETPSDGAYDKPGKNSRSLVKLCVCRSSISPTKSGSAMTGRNVEEMSTAVAPLPVSSSRASFASPLRFLFSHRKEKEKDAGGGGGGRDPDHETSQVQQIEVSIPWEEDTQPSFTSQIGEEHEEHTTEGLFPESNDGTLDPSVNAVSAILSDALAANLDTGKDGKRGWFAKITDLRGLWPHHKPPQKLNEESKPEVEENDNMAEVKTDAGNASSTGSSQNSKNDNAELHSDSFCHGCDLDSPDGCSIEVPYNRVLHGKESFSRFIQEAPLNEMKVVAQLSYLCDMAYMIPDIQPGQLLKYHDLKFIISSLDKKAAAQAEAKAREQAEAKAKEQADSKAKRQTDTKTKERTEEKCKGKVEAPAKESKDGTPFDSTLSSGKSPDPSCLLSSGLLSQSNRAEECQISPLSQVDSWNDDKGSSKEDSLMAVAPATAVVLAEEETKQAVAKDLHTSGSCPSEWFVVDDPHECTRIFVIQGSESLASWQANLLFEPTKFEDLDVLVHRGIYEAANALYEQVLPEVLEHFGTYGDSAQFRFTGHSLGGSLATLLALMIQVREVLPKKAILPVVTFGSPCIMCGGDYLLKKLDLPKNHIQSIVMHRDVVPRAFSCDYPDHVAQVLKRLNGRFRDHPCLNNQKLLYAPMGQMLILQPEENTAPCHPLLPTGQGLYLLRHPINGEDKHNATELRAAQRAFLNMPHPLEILSDPGAYGFEGAISRDHDPRNYTRAINQVIMHEVRRLRKVQRQQRRLLWSPLIFAESSRLNRKGMKAGVTADERKTSGPLTHAICRTPYLFSQASNSTSTNFIGLALCKMSVWQTHKGTFSRYARVIASQHVQLGMLLILSVKMVVLEGLSTVLVWI